MFDSILLDNKRTKTILIVICSLTILLLLGIGIGIKLNSQKVKRVAVHQVFELKPLSQFTLNRRKNYTRV